MSNERNEMDSYPYRQGKRPQQVEDSGDILWRIFSIIIGFVMGISIIEAINQLIQWAF